MDLQDKVIVVTGGGAGIGEALCHRFAEEDPARIIVVDRKLETAESVARAIGGQAIGCDVAVESEVQAMIQQGEQQQGRIDLFCANAGVGKMGGVELSNDDWKRVMDINFMSHVYSSRALLPGMIERGSGYLLHTASAAGLLTQVGSAPYAVSKHAAVALAEWLSVTHADQGIRVSCLCPLGVKTQLVEGDHPVLAKLRESAISVEAVAEAVMSGIQEERFLILPHPVVAEFMQRKASDPDRWLAGMRKWCS